jgi:hypothetical protein
MGLGIDVSFIYCSPIDRGKPYFVKFHNSRCFRFSPYHGNGFISDMAAEIKIGISEVDQIFYTF